MSHRMDLPSTDSWRLSSDALRARVPAPKMIVLGIRGETPCQAKGASPKTPVPPNPNLATFWRARHAPDASVSSKGSTPSGSPADR